MPLKELIGQSTSLRHRFDVSSDQHNEVMRETAATGQEALATERQAIELQCDQTHETVERKKSFLDDSLRRWTSYETKHLKFVQWTQLAHQRLQHDLRVNTTLEERQQLTSTIQVSLVQSNGNLKHVEMLSVINRNAVDDLLYVHKKKSNSVYFLF